ncbi:MAG: DUF1217 domain-containing protein [Marinosulfonomonas sp.]|nr:DUF1217 domain-containing protein [Marinosulfonomonas sp.]
MSFQPIVLSSGYTGWTFLARTKEDQQEALSETAQMRRETDYFRDNIANAKTASDLVADRRLLSVALGAFGLHDDIGNTFFIKSVLEDGTLDDGALGNRLSDKRYLAMSKAFGFGDFSIANTQLSDFPDKIITGYQDQEFELRIGTQDEDLRLALGVEREVGALLSTDTTDDGYWFLVMGNPPLRRVFETALGMPASLSGLDLDRQLLEFREKASQILGDSSVQQFSDPEKQEWLVRRFLIRTEAENSFASTSSGSVALALLQNAGY